MPTCTWRPVSPQELPAFKGGRGVLTQSRTSQRDVTQRNTARSREGQGLTLKPETHVREGAGCPPAAPWSAPSPRVHRVHQVRGQARPEAGTGPLRGDLSPSVGVCSGIVAECGDGRTNSCPARGLSLVCAVAQGVSHSPTRRFLSVTSARDFPSAAAVELGPQAVFCCETKAFIAA